MAAQEFSFDIVSKVDLAEVKNAFNQAEKDLQNRYDLKGTAAEIELGEAEFRLTAGDDFQLSQLRDIAISKLQKRGIGYKMIVQEKIEPAGGMTVKQRLTFKQGLEQEEAKKLAKEIKGMGLKVNSQVQGDAVRVSGKAKDDLQKVMANVKAMDLPYEPSFDNMR
jgi:uncharacterized protein YajQ (UPF0234 family)